jgi:hypothetical protein
VALTSSVVAWRVAHSLITVGFLSSIAYVWWCAISYRRGPLLRAAVAALVAEGFLVTANQGDCPLGPLGDRLGDDVPLFELVLPPKAARLAVPVLGAIYCRRGCPPGTPPPTSAFVASRSSRLNGPRGRCSGQRRVSPVDQVSLQPKPSRLRAARGRESSPRRVSSSRTYASPSPPIPRPSQVRIASRRSGVRTTLRGRS